MEFIIKKLSSFSYIHGKNELDCDEKECGNTTNIQINLYYEKYSDDESHTEAETIDLCKEHRETVNKTLSNYIKRQE